MSKATTLQFVPKIPRTRTEDITLIELLTLTQEELFAYLKQNLPSVTRVGKTLLIDPPMPDGVKFRPLLCSHLDIVGCLPPKKEDLILREGTISLSPKSAAKVVGGDDRCGVYIMLQLIFSEHRNKYTYAFFKDEEIGCVGSTAFTTRDEFTKLEEKTSMFIGVDRKCDPWKPEIATYNYDDPDLEAWMEEELPRFEVNWGSVSDCSVLSEFSVKRIPCFNFSAGYRNEHTRSETIHISTMNRTLDALMSMELPNHQFEYEETKFNSRWGYTYAGYGPTDYEDYEGYSDPVKGKAEQKTVDYYIPGAPIVCDLCGDHAPLFESEDGFNYVCQDCFYDTMDLKEN